MMGPILATRELHKSFGALTVTRGVSLSVAPGELHALIGPNGAGKTTLIGQIMGTIAPASGHVELDGADVYAPVRRRIAARAWGWLAVSRSPRCPASCPRWIPLR